MTRFWLVRHGPTHEKAITGWRDVPADLSDLAALARLSAYLPENAALVSSDLLRCVATADAIAQSRRRLAPRASLREFDFGRWDGKTFAEVDAMDPDLCRRFWEGDPSATPPDGESWDMVSKRVSGSLIDLAEQQPETDIIVVGHMGMIMTMIGLCGFRPFEAMGHTIDTLSVTDMTYDGTTWRIGSVNHRA